ncbi:MAG: hypothetical protein KDK36_03995 [Leptospiraceae bacterium]|nr:hypothetical protein [Leptospiraceae bacterium]
MRYLLLLLLLSFMNCNSAPKKDRNLIDEKEVLSTWNVSGWNIDPEMIKKNEIPGNPVSMEKDWFYFFASGKALDRAVELKSPSYMKSSCKISAIKENKNEIFKNALVSANEKWKNSPLIDSKVKEIFDTEKLDSLVCKATDEEKSYKTCECVIYFMYKGGKESLASK